MYAKHFIIYYKRGTGTFVVTEPKPWARENQNHFPEYEFLDNPTTPTTQTIEAYLINNHGFTASPHNNNNNPIHLIFNLDPNVNL